MITLLGTKIKSNIRGVLYLCKYDYEAETLTVVRELLFTDSFKAITAYCNIPNPESQLAAGNTKKIFEAQLNALHMKMNDPTWVSHLKEVL